MATYNFTGRPIRVGNASSEEIPSDGYAEIALLGAVERDVLLLNDGRHIPGTVSRPGNKYLKAPWASGYTQDSGIVLNADDVIIVNGLVAGLMEARDLKVAAQVWSVGETKRAPDGTVFADSPIRHKDLTIVYR